MGIIRGDDESAYLQDIENRVGWYRENNLHLNIAKKKEISTDLGKVLEVSYESVVIDGMEVERVGEFCFLGTTIRGDISWTGHICSLVSKAHQRLYFLRKLRRAGFSE